MRPYSLLTWTALSLSVTPLVMATIFLPAVNMAAPAPSATSGPTPPPVSPEATPFFRLPLVPGAEVSGFFDHDPASGSVVFSDGRSSEAGQIFYFSCPAVGGAAVGCQSEGTTESQCPDEDELWYDNHKGTDFEYSPDWRTGAACDRQQFEGLTREVYVPAPGRVSYVGYGRFNGNFIIINHDLNGDGDYGNDGLRSFYLHFADGGIAVREGQVLQEGDLLGTGGMTGLSWTPHLHFEVQRFLDGAWRSVDPYGWSGDGPDPWPYPNYPLWRTE